MNAKIPKFVSFQPKPKPKPPSDPPKESKSICNANPAKTSQTPSTLPTPSTPLSQPKSAAQPETALSRLYYSDRRGDPNVLRYGAPNRYDIPAYYRGGYGFVLGLASYLKIDREQSTSAAICLSPGTSKRQPRLLTDKRSNTSTHRALRLVQTNDRAQVFQQDFISLTGLGKSRHTESDDDEANAQDLAFRIIGPHPTANEPLDPDTCYVPDASVVIDTEVIRKSSFLARKTKEQPGHVQNWLDLIEHQEVMLKLDRPTEELTASDKAHLAQVRISIYEDALKKIGPDQIGQTKLWAGLLSEGRLVWDDVKSANKWKEVLAKYPRSIDLWWLYIDFVQSTFARFKYEDCRSAFLACVATITTGTANFGRETSLHILLRLTSMIRDAGYQELALAIWQSSFEFHLLRPTTERELDLQAMFEEFWESETARIGEPDAKGWKACATDGNPPPCLPSLIKSNASLTILDDFQRREMDAMIKLIYSGRTTDDVGEDDAFHTVFYSDIEPFLDIVPAETSAELLLEAFLCFCGLPPLPRPAAHQQTWWSDPFLYHHSIRASPVKSEPNQFMDVFEKYSGFPSHSFQVTTELLFRQSFALCSHGLELEFVRRVLKLLAVTFPDETIIGEYLLAFECRHFISDAFKTAKQLLRAKPSSLRLYHAYGFVELRRGDTAKANQIFSTALSMQKTETPIWAPESLQLYHTWVWEAWSRGQQSEALWRLVSPITMLTERNAQGHVPDHDTLQRTIHLLSTRTEHALLDNKYIIAVQATSLHALITYLTNDNNPLSALHIFQSLSAWLASHNLSTSPYAELHAQSIAYFLLHHATRASIFQPALLRTTLEPLITLFPNNTLLLALYAATETRFAIHNRVRDIIRSGSQHGAQTTSPATWAFAIQHEARRMGSAASTAHSTRAVYKRALETSASHCPALWTSFVHFELAQLRVEEARPGLDKTSRKKLDSNHITEARQRIKDTFYAGLQRLPWCKQFAMLPFSPPFQGEGVTIWDDAEKWKIWRVMVEKEIRLFIDIETDP